MAGGCLSLFANRPRSPRLVRSPERIERPYSNRLLRLHRLCFGARRTTWQQRRPLQCLQCAASGVTKSFAFERPDLRCRALDLHPEFVLEASDAAERIEMDLFGLDGEVEIGLDRDGRRWALVAFAENVVDDVRPLTGDDTWLVSGGGSGSLRPRLSGSHEPARRLERISNCLVARC